MENHQHCEVIEHHIFDQNKVIEQMQWQLKEEKRVEEEHQHSNANFTLTGHKLRILQVVNRLNAEVDHGQAAATLFHG